MPKVDFALKQPNWSTSYLQYMSDKWFLFQCQTMSESAIETEQVPNLTRRLKVNYNSFARSPVGTIKQILGQNTTLVSYKVNSIINWSGEVYVDVEYKSIPIDPFAIYFIPIDSIKHLIPNSEKYVCTVNGCNVKLNNPKLKDFKQYLPIKIKKSIINDTDHFDNYFSIIDESIEKDNTAASTTFAAKTNISTPVAMYFGTTVVNPMNALITPLSLLQQNVGDQLTQSPIGSFGFSITIPKKLYPDNYKPKNVYTIEETLKQYKQTISNSSVLSIVDNIEIYDNSNKSHDIFNSSSTQYSTTAYLITASQLPDHKIMGIILLQPKRVFDVMLFYPTNAYTISVEELNSIKQFIEADRINYYNFNFVKGN